MNWRDRELKELAKPLQIQSAVEEEMVRASFKMGFEEILDTHSAQYNEGFIDGWNRHIDQGAELGEIRREFENNLHNIYDAWLKKANAEVARHIT